MLFSLRRLYKTPLPATLLFFLLLFFTSKTSQAACSGTDSFTVSTAHCVGDNITFTNQSNSADSFIWVWGDGTSDKIVTSTAAQTHSYSNDGDYTVKLIRIITSTSCKQTYSLKIHVYDKPNPSFTFNNNNSCSGTTID
ncbi:MAG: hypothetical protein EOP53_19855, partial [Sphingobacteriales bacterium]